MKSQIEIGYIFTNTQGSPFTVIAKSDRINTEGYKTYWVVKFNDHAGYVREAKHSSILRGVVKNPYQPRIFGVGYLGVGPYLTRWTDPNGNSYKTKEYRAWQNMLERSYGEKYQARNPTYVGCSVHPDWHNFQTFAEWYTSQPNHWVDYFQLDKDLLYPGNKLYSSGTCVLIPGEINSMLNMGANHNNKSNLPEGYRRSPSGNIRAMIYGIQPECFSKTFKTLLDAVHWRNNQMMFRIMAVMNKYSLVLTPYLFDLIEYRLEEIFLIDPGDWLDDN